MAPMLLSWLAMKNVQPATKDLPSITELLENVRGGYDGADGGYCSTDAMVNAANGRTAACPQPEGSSGVGF